VSVFYALVANIDFFLQQLEGGISITVIIYNDVDAAGVINLGEQIRTIEYVSDVHYVSHQQAFEIAMEAFEDPEIFYGILPENFPRSFNIEIVDIQYHDTVLAALSSLSNMGIERVMHAQNVVRMVTTVSNMVRWISGSLIFVLAGVSIIIITNTIRITVSARQVEINIMKYVGATDWFIRWPFLIEGILIGVIGSLLPVIIVWSGYAQVIRIVQEGMPLVEFIEFRPGHEIFIILFPFVIFLGALIGIIGSGASIRRHLHV